MKITLIAGLAIATAAMELRPFGPFAGCESFRGERPRVTVLRWPPDLTPWTVELAAVAQRLEAKTKQTRWTGMLEPTSSSSGTSSSPLT